MREDSDRKVATLKKQMVAMETEMKKRTEAAMQQLKDQKAKNEAARKEKEKKLDEEYKVKLKDLKDREAKAKAHADKIAKKEEDAKNKPVSLGA